MNHPTDATRSRRVRPGPASGGLDVSFEMEDRTRRTPRQLWRRWFAQKFHVKKQPRRFTNDAIRVQLPMRMVLTTLSVFLIFPLVLFGWRERQIRITEGEAELFQEKQQQQHHHIVDGHERYPTWMDKHVRQGAFDDSNDSGDVAAGNGTAVEGGEDRVAETKSSPEKESSDQQDNPNIPNGEENHLDTPKEGAPEKHAHPEQADEVENETNDHPADKPEGETQSHAENPALVEENTDVDDPHEDENPMDNPA